MTCQCERSNPLVRSGSDRQSRVIPALDTDYFKVDERSLADFILFARNYAENIKFYGDGSLTNWKKFFEKDISVTLARLANMPLNLSLSFKDDLVNYLQNAEGVAESTVREYFRLYLNLPLLLLAEISQCRKALPSSDPLIAQLDKWVNKEVVSDLLLLKSFVLGAETQPLEGFIDQAIDTAQLNSDINFEHPLLVPEPLFKALTTLNWADTAAEIFTHFESLDVADLTTVVANPAPYATASNLHSQIKDALRYNLLVNAVENLLSAVKSVMDSAAQALELALTRDDHDPSYGLWLTFLKLYEFAQDKINGFTGRHLDFYFRDILQIANQSKQPDRVPLVFELAKHKDEYLVKAGTLLKAGKDVDGIERLYALENDAVINQAKIKELRSFFHRQEEGASVPYAAIKANSADGIDAALDKDNPQWPVFGPIHDNSLAEIGFAIADEKLRLSDGLRTITLSIDIPVGMPATIQNTFAAALTLEEDWLHLDSANFMVSKVASTLVFTIVLAGDQDAVAAYNAEAHGFNFTTQLPVLRIWILPNSNQFSAWQQVSFSTCRLQSRVDGTRTFTLSNDFGAIDTAKPFMPFGPQPAVNSHFVLGGKEIFSKPIKTLQIKPSWQESLGTASHYSRVNTPISIAANVEWLNKGVWTAASSKLAETLPFLIHASDDDSKSQISWALVFFILFGGDLQSNSVAYQAYLYLMGFGFILDDEQTGARFDDLDEQYKPSSTRGFVRFTLQQSLGHREFPQVNALAIMDKASTTFNYTFPTGVNYVDSIPKPPYTPMINDLTVSYQSVDGQPEQFFHQLPFGTLASTAENSRLLPAYPNQGELYIGLEKARPPQSVSLLFQAIEGSANPLKNPATLNWHYLSGDTWQEIKSADISDTSAALSGSGIIQFELPIAADTTHSILPSDLHWLRLSVTDDGDALCLLTAIHTQAVNAIWYDNSNSDLILSEPLAADSIAKLKTPDSAIKKIAQPLASEGGKPEEADEDYYQRVSERLRHKKRASTIWDYENLILQEFPQVYKVRCLNHTELCRDLENKVLAENGMHPGSVVVVPIPIIDPDSASDPHRPYNTTKTLADIDSYLRERISPFVHMEVQNPKIEEIQFKFTVAFRAHIIDTGFYIKLLNEEIKQFLMPWSVTDASSIDFNGSWYKSSIVNFIEERPYVDFIKDVQMFHRVDIEDSGTGWQNIDKGVVKASSARSILVSHRSHDISPYIEVMV